MKLELRKRSAAPWKIVAEGIAAGLAGTAAMTAAQLKVLARLPAGKTAKEPRFPSEWEAHDENPTETFARRFVEEFTYRTLPRERKKLAGYLVHFGTGATLGGLLSLFVPKPTLKHGLLFGAIAWVVNDNLLLPLLRLGDWPDRYPAGAHL
ncbi:MAG: hypothetical protein ACK4N5_11095, partial [Myxococcales bacterium]